MVIGSEGTCSEATWQSAEGVAVWQCFGDDTLKRETEDGRLSRDFGL